MLCQLKRELALPTVEPLPRVSPADVGTCSLRMHLGASAHAMPCFWPQRTVCSLTGLLSPNNAQWDPPTGRPIGNEAYGLRAAPLFKSGPDGAKTGEGDENGGNERDRHGFTSFWSAGVGNPFERRPSWQRRPKPGPAAQSPLQLCR
uniref:Uncharacterized protein n=1 Tax=Trichuris muris TaxID=70415 RepID=A0A5S6QE94_TRIMR